MNRRRKIGITQRVTTVTAYHERRDTLDQVWGSLLETMGNVPIPLCNRIQDVSSYLTDLEIDAVLLTGGNNTSTPDSDDFALERNIFETKLLDHCQQNPTIPVVGVCRGFQMLNLFMGGELTPVSGHAGTTHIVQSPKNSKSTLSVNSYHNFGITTKGLASNLLPCCVAEDGTIEAAYHSTLPWSGIMWHPERRIEEQHRQLEILEALLLGDRSALLEMTDSLSSHFTEV